MKQLKRWLSGLLAACIAAAVLPGAAAVSSDPALKIELRRVTGGDTVEISLLAEPGDAPFMAAEAVLEYDVEKLVPIQWGAAGGAVSVPEGTGEWTSVVSAKTMAPGGVSHKPSLTFRTADTEDAAGKGYLYLGAESMTDPLSDEDAKDGAVVTARFRMTEAGKTAAADDTDGSILADWVRMAPADMCTYSPPGYAAAVTTQDGAQFVYEMDALAGDTGAKELAEPTFQTLAGLSRYADAKLESGGYTVTFFDWDGRAIDAIAAPQDALENVELKTDEWKKDGGPLADKKGYRFYGWLRVTQGKEALQTAYGTFAAAPTQAVYQAEPASLDFADFSDLADETRGTDTLLVQAAYVETEACNTGDDLTSRYYTVSDPVYNRYGAASAEEGKYSVTYTVKRENAGGYGVTKLEQPAVYVVMKPQTGNQDVVTKIDLQNTDETTFEVVPTKAMKSVQVTVINTYGFTSWPQSTERSLPVSVDRQTYVREGTAAYIRDQAIAQLAAPGAVGTDWDLYVDAVAFSDAGLTVSNLATAKANILAAMATLTPAQQKQVGRSELQIMINTGAVSM